MVTQEQGPVSDADRPAFATRAWPDRTEVAADVGDSVWAERLAESIRHPALGDAPEVDPRATLQSRSAGMDLEHVAQPGQRLHRVQRGHTRTPDQRT